MKTPGIYQLGLGNLDQTIITMKIGPKGRVFNVHKGILCKKSTYFKAAFSDNWKGGQENSISLDEADPDVFGNIVLEWLYAGHLSELTTSNEVLSSMKAYIFAYRYDIPGLRQDLINLLYNQFIAKDWDMLPKYEVIITSFNVLPSSSKLCQFLIDLYADRWNPGFDEGDGEASQREQLPASFSVPLMVHLGKRANGKVLKDLDKYTEHRSSDDH